MTFGFVDKINDDVLQVYLPEIDDFPEGYSYSFDCVNHKYIDMNNLKFLFCFHHD